MSTKIELNAGYCHNCQSVLVSRHRHDYVTCICETPCAVDGGAEYLRRSIPNEANFEDLSIVTRDDIDYNDLNFEDTKDLLIAYEKWLHFGQVLLDSGKDEEQVLKWLTERNNDFVRRWVTEGRLMSLVHLYEDLRDEFKEYKDKILLFSKG